MKKLVKFAAWALAGLLLASVATLVLLKIYFPPEKIRRLALEYASRQFNREVRIESASVGLGGVSLKGLSVSEAGNFKNGNFLKAGDFQAKLSLRPLLRGEFKINSVSASDLSLRIKQLRSGVYNFSDLIPAVAGGSRPAAKAEEKTGRQAKAVPFSVTSFSLDNFNVNYYDSVSKLSVVVHGKKLKAENVSTEGPIDLRAEFYLEIKSHAFSGSIPVKTSLSVNPAGWDPAMLSAKIRELAFSMDKISAEISGAVGKGMDAELRISVAPFSSSALRKYFPSVPPKLLLPGITADSRFKATTDSVEIRSLSVKAGPVTADISGNVRWNPRIDYTLKAGFSGSLPETGTDELRRHLRSLPKGFKIPASSFSAGLLLRPGRLKAEPFKMTLGAIKTSGSADLNYSGRSPLTSVSVKIESMPLEELAYMAPFLREYEPGGAISGGVRLSHGQGLSYSGTLNLSGIAALFAGRKLSGLRGPVSFTQDSMKAGPLAGKLDGSALSASFSARGWDKTPLLTFDLFLEKLALDGQEIASPPASAKGPEKKASPKSRKQPAGKEAGIVFNLDGKTLIERITHPNFTGEKLEFRCDLRNISADMTGLTGKASFEIRGGGFRTFHSLPAVIPQARFCCFLC
ncbi:MAG: AsmA family protein [bacterium]